MTAALHALPTAGTAIKRNEHASWIDAWVYGEDWPAGLTIRDKYREVNALEAIAKIVDTAVHDIAEQSAKLDVASTSAPDLRLTRAAILERLMDDLCLSAGASRILGGAL